MKIILNTILSVKRAIAHIEEQHLRKKVRGLIQQHLDLNPSIPAVREDLIERRELLDYMGRYELRWNARYLRLP